jgi:monoamine oxidase
MARTPLARSIQAAVAAVDEERGITRRRFLVGAGAALAAARLATPARGFGASKVVVVGAGLAGLACAYKLQQKGINADIYEASNRLGGRCWTGRGAFADGQIYEHGGELIDTGHAELRKLIRKLGLDTVDLLDAEARGTDEGYWFDGAPYSHAQASKDLKAVMDKLTADVDAAGYPTQWNSFTQRGFELDHMSIIDWINESVPGGIHSRFGQLLDVAYNIEYGAESSQQSALNLLYLLGFSEPGPLSLYGESDERFHVVGGNDQVPQRLGQALDSHITTGTELVAIKKTSGGGFTLTFRKDSGTKTVNADIVVLTVPFSIMRRSVDYSRAGFEPLKDTAIRELGMGTNSKLHLQFSKRIWNDLGSNASTYADTGYQSTWEVTRGQDGRSGILVDYTGGTIGASFGSGTLDKRAKQFLGQIEPVLPGITRAWNGRATLDFWTGYEWTRGSYAYFKVGQYTKFAGMEAAQQGNCHFAGEHTSTDFQGYMNGAVESGQRAADEVLADI